jgi:hypothetical protein
VNGSRTTTATGKNGNTYTGTTTDTNGLVTHTATCKDASGNVILCQHYFPYPRLKLCLGAPTCPGPLSASL